LVWRHGKRIADVRFGSKADISQRLADVRYSQKADIRPRDQDVCFGPLTDMSLIEIKLR
jgi:hypothetical protein